MRRIKIIISVLLTVSAILVCPGCVASQDGRSAQGNQGKSVNDVLNEKMNESSRQTEISPDQSQNNPSPDSRSVDEDPVENSAKEKTVETPPDPDQSDAASVNRPSDAGAVDVDLTNLSSTMVYSEVYNMMTEPEKYMGKRVRMKGFFSYLHGFTSEGEKFYFSCVITDAAACCAQGLEFVLEGDKKFPDDYPEKGEEITVVGTFDTYYEGQARYCQLIDAVME